MARAFLVGNGSIVATGDRHGSISELYVPSLAPEHQLLRRPARVGLSVDGSFRWLSDGFDSSIARSDDAPIADLSLTAPDLPIEVWIETFADSRLPVIARRVQVTNRDDRAHDVRLSFHHDFRLSTGTREAAARDVATGGVVHHGGRRVVLLNVIGPDGPGVPLVTIADEGDSADSLLGIPLPLASGASAMVTLWIAVAGSIAEARRLDGAIRRQGIAALVTRTQAYWSLWTSGGARDRSDLPDDVRALYTQALVTLRLHQTPTGAILSASEPPPDAASRPEHRWCWLRDAALAADALGRAGYPASTRRYLEFTARSAREAGELLSVLDASGAPAAAPEIAMRALDGVALHLWAAARHFERDRDPEFMAPIYDDVIVPAAERLAESSDPALGLPLAPDPWDERWGAHASVAAAVRGGLSGASRLAAFFGETARARSWITASDQIGRAVARRLFDPGLGRFARTASGGGDPRGADHALDATLLWLGLFDDLEPEDPRVRATADAVRAGLWVRSGIGGLVRHEHDAVGAMEGGPESPACPSVAATLWLAQHAIRAAHRLQDLEEARILLLWAAARAEGGGHLPEHLSPADGGPVGVCPSLTATSGYVAAVLDYAERARMLARCDRCGEPAPARHERRSLPSAPREPASLPGIVAHL